MRPVGEAPARAVVVMGKLPRPGVVKTRLARRFGADLAARLYRAFLLDVFAVVEAARAESAIPFARVFACALGAGGVRADAEALAPTGWRVEVQGGEDLGQRIEHARAAAGAALVVVLGSDAPTMPPARIHEAFAALAGGAEAVFGPTVDGGYDLAGFAGPRPALLGGIPWSTAGVMPATRARAVAAGIAIAELGPGRDIDEPEDLGPALSAARAPGSIAAHTRAAIEEALAALPAP